MPIPFQSSAAKAFLTIGDKDFSQAFNGASLNYTAQRDVDHDLPTSFTFEAIFTAQADGKQVQEFFAGLSGKAAPYEIPLLRVVDNEIWMLAGTLPVTIRVGRTHTFSGKLFACVGKTRGPNDNRQRRFVRRGDRIVEVRARGRSPHRSVFDALTDVLDWNGVSARDFRLEATQAQMKWEREVVAAALAPTRETHECFYGGK